MGLFYTNYCSSISNLDKLIIFFKDDGTQTAVVILLILISLLLTSIILASFSKYKINQERLATRLN